MEVENMNELLDPDSVHGWLSSIWSKEKYPNLVAGINDDDCAVIKVDNVRIVVTTDYLNSNPIAKQLGIASNRDLGRLLVAANLSDLLGSGAKPIAFLASIMLEKGSTLEQFSDIMNGIKFELDKYNIPLVGGDTKLGGKTALCGTAIGLGNDSQQLFLKNGARVNDKIWLSSSLGNVGAAVIGLTNGDMSSEWNDWAKDKLINPNLPFDKSISLSKTGLGKGGTDISDGLGEDLYDMCESSKVGAIIYSDKLPTEIGVLELSDKLNIPHWFFNFSIGGDFQFIVTSDPKDTQLLDGLGFTEIGIITDDNKVLLSHENELYKLPRLGHSDFKIKDFSSEVSHMLNQLKFDFEK